MNQEKVFNAFEANCRNDTRKCMLYCTNGGMHFSKIIYIESEMNTRETYQ